MLLVTSFHLTNETLITCYFCSTWSLGWYAKKFIVSFNTSWKSVSTPSYSVLWKYHVKEIKIQKSESWDYQKASWQLIWVSNKRSQSTHCDKVLKRWKKQTVKKVKCSSVSITLLINCTKLNWWSLKLSTENQWLLCSLFYNMVNRECWKTTTISSKNFWPWEVWRTWNGQRLLLLGSVSRSLEEDILPEKRDEWNAMRSVYGTDTLTANASDIFFPRTCHNTDKKHNKMKRGLFIEEFRCTEMLCLCNKTYCCYDEKSNNYRFSSKGLSKRTLEDCDDGLMSKYRRVLDESVYVTLTNRGFRTVQHAVATYEQTKIKLFFVYPKDCIIWWNTYKTLAYRSLSL